MQESAVKHKLPLSLEYNVNLGYHIHVVVPRGLNLAVFELPAEFIQVARLSPANRCAISILRNASRNDVGTKKQEILHDDYDGAVDFK